MTPAELLQEGWQKRLTYDEPRLSEMAEMYESLGLEVLLVPFVEAGDCSECLMQAKERYKTIYTRERITRPR